MRNINDLVGYIQGCLNVIKDTKGEVFETGREVGQIELYLREIKTILNQPKEENKSNDSFQWTDELVKEFAEFRSTRLHFPVGYMLIEFIASHTPKPQAENKPITPIPLLNKEDEKLRNKYSENKPDRDWEIVQLRGKHGKHLIYEKKDGMWLNEYSCGWGVDGNEPEGTGCEIHSVKRLSDGEVFSVGEKFYNDHAGIYTEETIKEFNVDGKDMKVYSKEDDGFYFIQNLKKTPTPTTERRTRHSW